ncbi:MAG: hypothetical protein OSJ59_04295 [Lachnospiraceae bacterium]|nr:hypothetical protein [Lachnospiraceae bacterium]
MVQRPISTKNIKAGDKYNADIGNVLELLAGISEVGRKDRAIVADTALMIGIILLFMVYQFLKDTQ